MYNAYVVYDSSKWLTVHNAAIIGSPTECNSNIHPKTSYYTNYGKL